MDELKERVSSLEAKVYKLQHELKGFMGYTFDVRQDFNKLYELLRGSPAEYYDDLIEFHNGG